MRYENVDLIARAQGADRSGARRARRRRDGESRQEPVPRRGEPRPAPAAARDRTVRGGARRQGARSGREAAGREHPRVAWRRSRDCSRSCSTCRGSKRARCTLRRPASRSTRCSRASPPISRRRRARADSRCSIVPTRLAVETRSGAARAHPAQPRRQRGPLHARPAASCSARVDAANAVRIDVIDTGVGIADDDRARVFDEFVQLAAAARHHAGGRGMGLGLAIVRRLAALLGHPVEMASMPGRGSRFSITVPRTRSAHRACRAPRRCIEAPPATASPALAGTPRRRGRRRSGRASRRCTRCSLRGRRPPPAAPTRTLRSLPSPRWDATDATPSTSSSPTSAWPTAHRASTRSRELRAALGAGTPALIVSGDTSGAAQAEVQAAGIRLLLKPVVAAALKDAAEAALRQRTHAWTATTSRCVKLAHLS